MKKLLIAIIVLVMLTVSAAALAEGGELLLDVDYTNEAFKTFNASNDKEVAFADRFNVTAEGNYISFFEKEDDPAADTHLWYVMDTGLEITTETQYTYFFEAATPTNGKYDGIAFATNGTDYYCLYGSFSNNGDDGGSAFRIKTNTKDGGALGYVDQNAIMLPVTKGEDGFNYASLKIEIDGLTGTVYYREATGEWTAIAVWGTTCHFTLPEGCQMVVGVYGRDGNRPLAVKNAQIVKGIGIDAPIEK